MKQLLLDLNKLGIKLRAEGGELRVNAPPGVLTEDLRQALRQHKEQIVKLLQSPAVAQQPLPLLTPDPARLAEAFPLTELQHAYWLGRDSAMEMGNVATHLYVELDCAALDVARLNDALCRMIERHDMLRAVVGGDGMQRILPSVPRYRIMQTDVSAASPEAAQSAVMETRDALSHQVLKADQWPLFDIRATLLPAERVRLHVSLDLLILDAWSIFLFFKEWHQLYQQPQTVQEKFELSFRDYVLAEQGLQQSESHRRAHAYWMQRVETLPAAPELPLRAELSARRSPRFSRREARLEKSRWAKLRSSARDKGLTPSGLLLAAYSEVLARWSATPHFTVNVTVSNRLPLHPQVNSLLGDFTSLVMQEVDLRDADSSFLERARRTQQQFLTDMEHREVSGVTVMREWAKRRGISLQAAMPVVFSSGLIWSGDEEPGDLEQFGKKVYSVSQTSQVWLDHHVMELNGDLVFIWDAADAVFEDGVLDAMFASYCKLIERLADDAAVWDRRDIVALPDEMQERREAANRTEAHLPQQRLHAGFVGNALRNPQAPAVLSPARTLRYGELLAESAAVADWLIQSGVQAGQPVAVVMRKGWEQVVAVYGILLAGAAYMPIDADLPAKRQLDLLRIGEVRQVLTQPGAARDELNTDEWAIHTVRPGAGAAYGAKHAASLEGALDQLAYVIFTSGTTGVPKGVMIDHRGVANTIEHINRMYRVGAQDRVLAVSSLSFDLSVYDIFGLLDAGGALVLPDYRKGHDPIHWRDLIVEHQVTLWNSAPQLMRMLMDSFFPGEEEEAPLRTVLLSGDFIPLDLPRRIRARYPQAEVVSLGGATEASIWSIHYPVHEVAPGWTSIPYGKALPNQSMWVLDSAFRPCPDQVKGRIHIGGIGLAIGYWRDADKTAARFVINPHNGERLYDTGDLGRYAADGNIVILGRDDGQIKIRGHRVELGEIEAVLRQHPAVRQAIVVPTAAAAESRQLLAYVEFGSADAASHGTADRAAQQLAAYHPDAQAMKAYLAERLPDYMVPRTVVALDAIPVSANGKIDYKALPVVEEDVAQNRARVLPRNAAEQAIFDAWSRVITGIDIGVTDNFFELGGDSVLATQLVRELNASMPFQLEMHELFENLTIEMLAALYQSRAEAAEAEIETTSAVVPLRKNEPQAEEQTAILADVDKAVASFDEIDFSGMPAPSPAAPRALLLTGGTGWVGAQVLAQLLTATSAQVYCLVRAADKAAGRQRLIDNLLQCGVDLAASWGERIVPVCGDLSAPALGLCAADWSRLAQSVDAIYHLGASVNVLADYATHSKVNVTPLAALVRLAAEDHRKAVFFLSPMTVCRRHIEGRLQVLAEERGHGNPDGLLTGYAQSKWAAEQVLLAAAERGLPVTIYRTSHALPTAGKGLAKANDSYGSVLKTACAAGVVPAWADSKLHGVPTDTLARLLVEDSLAADGQGRVVHIENRDPLSLQALLGLILGDGENAACVPLEEWKLRCIAAAEDLPGEDAALARMLFTRRAVGSAVENMFSEHVFETQGFERSGQGAKLEGLTPASYWEGVAARAGWDELAARGDGDGGVAALRYADS